MINIGYRASRIHGYSVRSIYRAALPWLVERPIDQKRKVQMAVYSFSGDRDLPEQVASIRSFIRYVGIPDKFTVVSDGSHSPDNCKLLSRISPCVEVVELESLTNKDLPSCVYTYANYHPLGKKIAILISLPVKNPTIFCDSDILFFNANKFLVNWLKESGDLPRYLPDCNTALDERLIYNSYEKNNPVNSGFLLLKQPLNWQVALDRLSLLKETPNYFTEQTMVHLTMHSSRALPLCPKKFVVSLDDQFIYSDKYASHKIALRHYVSPVRHKFWMNVKN